MSTPIRAEGLKCPACGSDLMADFGYLHTMLLYCPNGRCPDGKMNEGAIVETSTLEAFERLQKLHNQVK